jgi:Phage integrase family
MGLRDLRMIEAFAQGREEIKPLVFPGPTGRPLDYSWFSKRVWYKALEAARLRRVTIHALRHSYASFLIQAGASLAYIRDQLGHSSIQVTVDVYGHLVPADNIVWTDSLNYLTSPQLSRNKKRLTLMRARKSFGMVGVEGLEPPTLGLEIRCSIHLSYTPAECAPLESLAGN